MIDDKIDPVIRSVSQETGIPITVLEKAWKNQFEVVREEIGRGNREVPDSFRVVYIKHIGKFIPNMRQLNWFNEYGQDRRKGNKRDKGGVDEVSDTRTSNGD